MLNISQISPISNDEGEIDRPAQAVISLVLMQIPGRPHCPSLLRSYIHPADETWGCKPPPPPEIKTAAVG